MATLKERFLAAGEEAKKAQFRSSYEALQNQIGAFGRNLPGCLEIAAKHLEEKVDKSVRYPAPASLKVKVILDMDIGEIAITNLPEINRIAQYCMQPEVNCGLDIKLSYLDKPTATGGCVQVTVSVDPFKNYSGVEYSEELPTSRVAIKQSLRPWIIES